MLFIYPIGGLGNMFYHIASIWTLAKDNGDDLCLLNIDQKIQNTINDKRESDLSHAYQWRYLFDRFPIANTTVKNKIEYPFQYIPLVYKAGHQYIGYFQHEEYFKHRRKEILELFGPADWFKPQIDKYSHLFGYINLHIRRHLRVSQGTAFTVAHCEEAVSKLPKDLQVVVFSDDIGWCKQHLIGDRYVFIEELDYISLYIMAKMKYHIIGRLSTFSWWGAWMCQYEDKVVIPPL